MTQELLTELWIAREKLRKPGTRTDLTSRQKSKGPTWSQYCMDIGSQIDVVNRWLLAFEEGSGAKALRLSMLGWTQEEIGERLRVDQGLVSKDMKNSHLGKIHKELGPHWNDKGLAE